MKMVSIPEEELERLKEKNRRQARQITLIQECLAKKNIELDAMHFVWCDGGCQRGVHRYTDTVLTEEMVLAAIRNTRRLSSWYNSIKWQLTRYPTMSEWHKKYAENAAKRTDLLTIEGIKRERDEALAERDEAADEVARMTADRDRLRAGISELATDCHRSALISDDPLDPMWVNSRLEALLATPPDSPASPPQATLPADDAQATDTTEAQGPLQAAKAPTGAVDLMAALRDSIEHARAARKPADDPTPATEETKP